MAPQPPSPPILCALALRRSKTPFSLNASCRAAMADSNKQGKGCLSTRIDKQSVVWCLGHLPSHIDGKVTGLLAAGFPNAKPLYCQSQSPEEIKGLLAASPNSLLYVGGAMMKTHPELMADLFAWQAEHAPTLAIEVLGLPHFARWAPGHSMPPSEEDVACVSVLHVASLADAWAAVPL